MTGSDFVLPDRIGPPPAAVAAAPAAPPAPAEAGGGEIQPFGADGLTFGDVLDIINPLQHIPVVSAIYREITGDEISPVPRLLGGTLFGGPIGAGAAFVNMLVEAETGKDLGGQALAFLGLTRDAADDGTAVADGEAAPADIGLLMAQNVEVTDWARREVAARAAGFPGAAPALASVDPDTLGRALAGYHTAALLDRIPQNPDARP